MPNPAQFYPDEPLGGPCRNCVFFSGLEPYLGREVVRCQHPKQGSYFFADADKGCKFFEREPGSDDE
jgi:hypothetical protein